MAVNYKQKVKEFLNENYLLDKLKLPTAQKARDRKFWQDGTLRKDKLSTSEKAVVEEWEDAKLGEMRWYDDNTKPATQTVLDKVCWAIQLCFPEKIAARAYEPRTPQEEPFTKDSKGRKAADMTGKTNAQILAHVKKTIERSRCNVWPALKLCSLYRDLSQKEKPKLIRQILTIFNNYLRHEMVTKYMITDYHFPGQLFLGDDNFLKKDALVQDGPDLATWVSAPEVHVHTAENSVEGWEDQFLTPQFATGVAAFWSLAREDRKDIFEHLAHTAQSSVFDVYAPGHSAVRARARALYYRLRYWTLARRKIGEIASLGSMSEDKRTKAVAEITKFISDTSLDKFVECGDCRNQVERAWRDWEQKTSGNDGGMGSHSPESADTTANLDHSATQVSPESESGGATVGSEFLQHSPAGGDAMAEVNAAHSSTSPTLAGIECVVKTAGKNSPNDASGRPRTEVNNSKERQTEDQDYGSIGESPTEERMRANLLTALRARTFVSSARKAEEFTHMDGAKQWAFIIEVNTIMKLGSVALGEGHEGLHSMLGAIEDTLFKISEMGGSRSLANSVTPELARYLANPSMVKPKLEQIGRSATKQQDVLPDEEGNKATVGSTTIEKPFMPLPDVHLQESTPSHKAISPTNENANVNDDLVESKHSPTYNASPKRDGSAQTSFSPRRPNTPVGDDIHKRHHSPVQDSAVPQPLTSQAHDSPDLHKELSSEASIPASQSHLPMGTTSKREAPDSPEEDSMVKKPRVESASTGRDGSE